MAAGISKYWAGVVGIAMIITTGVAHGQNIATSSDVSAPSGGSSTVPQMSDAELAERAWERFGVKFGGSPVAHLFIAEVRPNSLTAKAGIIQGDEVVKVAGAAATNVQSLDRQLLALSGGEMLSLRLRRGGTDFDVRLTMETSAESGPAAPASAPESNVFGMFIHQDRAGPVLVDRVSALSPAAKAGIKPGDVLVTVGGYPAAPVDRMVAGVSDILTRQQHGSGIPAEVVRVDEDKKPRTMTVQILPADASGILVNKQSNSGGAAPSGQGIEAGILGLALRFTSPNTVSVMRVAPGSPAAAAGIVPGDVITMVDQAPVATPEQFISIVGIHQMGEEINLVVMRQNKPFPTTMRLTPRVQDVAEATRVTAEAVASASFKTLEGRVQELSAIVQTLQAQVEQMAKQK